MSRAVMIIPCLVICDHRSSRGLLTVSHDNAITYKAQRDKNARELEAGERGNY